MPQAQAAERKYAQEEQKTRGRLLARIFENHGLTAPSGRDFRAQLKEGRKRGRQRLNTLTLSIPVTFTALEQQSDRSPDYRIISRRAEIGAGWKKTSERCGLRLRHPRRPGASGCPSMRASSPMMPGASRSKPTFRASRRGPSRARPVRRQTPASSIAFRFRLEAFIRIKSCNFRGVLCHMRKGNELTSSSSPRARPQNR